MTNNTEIAIKKETPIDSVRKALEKMKPQFAMALPSHITPDRLMRITMTAIQTTPKLLDCNRQSLFSAIMKAAQLGLEPDGILGQAYLIPFGENVQFIPGYKGLIDLARRSGEVSNIIAKEVYEKDEFVVDWSQDMPFIHKPLLTGDRGKVTHFWALARFKNGGFHWDYMTLSEVTEIRDNAQGYKAAVSWSKNQKNKKTLGQIISPWEQNFVEMGKKTVIRRISKFLPMSVQRAVRFDELQEAGKKVDINDLGDIIIEGESEVIDNETPETQTSKLDSFAGAANAESEVSAQNVEAAKSEAPEAEKENDIPRLTLGQWTQEIANAPTAAGVEYKYKQAVEQLSHDSFALNALKAAKEKRIAALSQAAA